jgi:uncharacterized repeat protein (TIGR01451 family)
MENNLENNFNKENNPREIEINFEEKSKFPWGKFFGFLFGLIVIFGALIGYLFYKPQPPEIKIEFEKPQEILAGESFNLGIIFSNNSSKAFNDVKLTLKFPEGISLLEDDPNKKNIEIQLGNLAPSSFVKQNFELIALSNNLEVKTINASFKYKVENSNIVFENNSQVDLNVERSAFDILVETPEKVFNAQKFKMTIKYQNNSLKDLDNIYLKVDFSPFYKFIDSNPKTNNNLWELGLVKTKQNGSIDLYGEVLGKENQSVQFNISALVKINNKFYTLANQNYNLSILTQPLALNILLNKEENYTASIGEYLEYTFQYKNNSNIPLENIVLKAKFDSNLFDFSTANTNGYFDSINNTFVWNSTAVPDFKSLASGGFGEVKVRIKLKDNFDINKENDKNFVLKIDAQIESTTLPPGLNEAKNISFYSFESKVRGFVKANAFGLYRDPQWQILNKGPYPPKVNTPTQYSIHLQIKNYATDLSNIKISGVIYPGTVFTGVTKSNIGITPKFDPNSNLVTIEIPKILANKGVLNDPIEIVFQLENTPSLNQVDKDVILFDNIVFKAIDDFTGEELSFSLNKVDTSLPYDNTIKVNNRRVSQ